MDATILICTYNRARHLGATLDSIAGIVAPGLQWEVLVVDNNSSDDTRAVVESRMNSYPVPLRYLFEPTQGKSHALNTGLRATDACLVAFTDDDVRIPSDWLTRTAAGFEKYQCDYLGGRVLPWWEAPPPRWIPAKNGRLWAAIALLDYGPAAMRFGRRIPLGVNMAVKKSAIDRVGGFNPRFGRRAGTLLGQEQREWCMRAHAAGLVGYYDPDIVLSHWVPRDRLTKRYFRSWFYWRGISRAMLYTETGADMENPDATLDVAAVPHVAGVPRYMFRSAIIALKDSLIAKVQRKPVVSFEREVWLWFFAGIVKQRWKDSRHSAETPRLRRRTSLP